MAAAVGGSILRVSFDGRNFPVAADNDANIKLGGMENEVSANGDGSARLLQTRVPWNVDGLKVENNESRGDHAFLQDLANRTDYFPVSITKAGNVTYQGRGQIVGEIKGSTKDATIEVSVMGPGEATQQ